MSEATNPTAEDVAAASAAYLFNVLPGITALPAPEAFERLKLHFETAIMTYQRMAAEGAHACTRLPQPSQN